ncbi:shikimate dehydrogenase [Alicyclobacillus sp. TC]|nr:shikimate dehydrogenase [Alicyclobacillus sp. TC]
MNKNQEYASAARLFGLIGYPVAHSVSPQMMSAAFTAMSIKAYYVPYPVHPERLEDALKGLAAAGCLGLNVTIPHKESVFARVSERTEIAQKAGAVNTLLWDGMQWIGHNTDVDGWWSSVKSDFSIQETKRVLLLGAGGAARAIVTALAKYAPGTRVQITSPSGKAVNWIHPFSRHLEVNFVSWANRHQDLDSYEWIINATPVGMWPNIDESPLEQIDGLHAGQIVQDIVYRPLQTKFLLDAKKQGAKVLDGVTMLAGQGAESLQFWLSAPAPLLEMETAARQALLSDNSRSSK